MKTTTSLFLLLFSSFFVYSQEHYSYFNHRINSDSSLRDGKSEKEMYKSEIIAHEFLPEKQDTYSYEFNKTLAEARAVASLTDKTIYCQGETLKLNAPEAESYLWQGPNNFSSNLRNPQIPNLLPINSGLYILTRIIGPDVYKDNVSIKVNLIPKITITRADEYCLGGNIILMAYGDKSYISWIAPNGKIYWDSINIPNASKDDSGTYTLKAAADGYYSECAVTISTEITVKESPCNSIELLPKKQLCNSGETELEFKVNGAFPMDEVFNLYNVSGNQKYLLASTTKSPFKFTVDGFGPYKLVIESTKHKTISNVSNYLYPVNVSYYIRRNFTQVCNGYTVPLYLESFYDDYKFDKVQWVKDGKKIPGANNFLYNAIESGTYWAIPEVEGCIPVDSVKRHVDVKIGEMFKPNIYSISKEPVVCDGFHVDLFCNNYYGFPEGEVTFQWQLNGIDIAGANSYSYGTYQSGDFSLKIRHGTCEYVSNIIKVKVGSLNISNISIKPSMQVKGNSVEICNGQEVELEYSSYLKNGNAYLGFIEGIRYQWQKDGVDLEGAVAYNYKTKDEGQYRLKITQGSCIVVSKEIFIKKNDVAKGIDFKGFKTDLCVGEITSGYIEGPGNNLTYKVYRNNELFTEVSRGNGFAIKDSGSYHAILNFITPDNSKSCLIRSDTMKVTLKEKIIKYTIDSVPSITCLDSLDIKGGNHGSTDSPTYQWKLNGTNIPKANELYLKVKEAGTYQLETQTAIGCNYLSDPVSIEFEKLDIKLNKYSSACYDSLNVYATYSYNKSDEIDKPIYYEWKLGDKIVGDKYYQPLLTAGTYNCSVKYNSCVKTDSIKVDNRDLKEEIIIPQILNPNTDSLLICRNELINIGAPEGDFVYTWFKNNQSFENNQSQILETSSEGTYKVWIQKEGCGSMSNAIIVKEKGTLPSAFISGDKELIAGDSSKIKIDLTSLAPWTIKLTNNQEFTTSTNPFEFAVKPLATTVYELASVRNECGEGTVSGKAEVKILILGNEELAGAKVKLYPIPTQGICRLSVETVIPEKIGFQLYNVEGKMLLTSEESKAGTSFKDTLSLESMPDGIYVLKIKIGDKILNRKIVKGN